MREASYLSMRCLDRLAMQMEEPEVKLKYLLTGGAGFIGSHPPMPGETRREGKLKGLQVEH